MAAATASPRLTYPKDRKELDIHALSKLVLAAAGGLLLSLPTPAHADKIIDPFTTAFNGYDDVGSLSAPGRYLWAGDWGTEVVAGQTTTGNQSISVAGVSGMRVATVQESTLTGQVVSSSSRGA